MTVQHREIPDAQRHEPKGASTALAGTFYVSDGAGSGTWTKEFSDGITLPAGADVDMSSTSRILVASGEGWKDMVSDLIVRGTGANDPAFELVTGASTMYAYSFSAGTLQQFWVSYHLNHDYAVGTKIYPHVHWFNAAAAPSTGVVRWGFEYVIAKGHNQSAFTYTSTTTAYVEQACPATRYQHMVAELDIADAIDSAEAEPDAIIHMRIFRDAAHANDTCADKVYVLTADCHYQSNTFATKNKAPDFYT